MWHGNINLVNCVIVKHENDNNNRLRQYGNNIISMYRLHVLVNASFKNHWTLRNRYE